MRPYKQFAVYILASRMRGTLYIGSTQHKDKVWPGFSQCYNVTRLVHYEWLDTAEAAIKREKQLKHWVRAWKINLIEATNPAWRDLWPELVGLSTS